MKLSKFTVIMAVLLMAILAIGAVSAESIADTDVSIAAGDGDLDLQSIDDSAEDLSAADTINDVVSADEDVEENLGDDGTENPSYELNDGTYSTYFENDGTAKEILVPADEPGGDYNLVIGTLNNKDIVIDSGSQIKIIAKEGEGIINNGTLTIGDGYGSAGSVFISGLTFNNVNKDGIAVKEGGTDIQIDNNKFNLEYDSTYQGSPMAIVTYGFVSGVSITDNEIYMNTAIPNSYGIDLTYYVSVDPPVAGMAGAEDFDVSGNTIIINSTAQSGMAEGIYLDTLSGSVIENNIIKVSTIGACANYGMQLADSYAFFDFDNYAPSPYDVTIRGNEVFLNSVDKAYGITVISVFGWGPDMTDIVKDLVVADNIVNIVSQKGAIAIGTKGSDVEVTDNTVFVIADEEAINEGYIDGEFGNVSAAILLVTFDANMGMGDYDYSNITVTGNTITSAITPIKVTKNETGNAPLVVQDNTINNVVCIDDQSYSTYFNDDGTVKDDAPINENDVLVLGELNNKKFVIDVPLTIKGLGDKQVNTTISLVSGADGTTITGLDMDYVDDGSVTFAVIAVNNGVSNVVIADNTINAVTAASWNYDMGISVYGAPVGSENITISGNTITMSGNAGGLYGIDVQNYDPNWAKGNGTTGLNISGNTVTITGTGMVEPIYIASSNDILVDGNKITSSTNGGDAYGIGTSTLNNFTVTNNEINVLSENNMAYGVASPDSTDVVIDNNNITALGVGAIGVGFVNDANVEVDGNIINITGDDYTTVSTYEKIGTGDAAILDKSGNTGVAIGENTIIENCPLTITDANYATYFNEDGTIKDDAPINENDLIFLGELNNKKFVIDVPLTIKGANGNKLTNTTISLVSGADGTAISGLDMDYEDDGTATFAIIAVNNGVSNVLIADNTINAVTASSYNYDMGISVYGAPVGSENITISGNTITMSGNAGGLYGIDVQNYDPNWAKGNGTTGLNISGNTVTITGTGMVEPIYIASSNDILVDGNKITSSSTGGDAYGIGTSANNNFTVTNNEINVLSENNMAYGIASPDSTDVVIDNNNITAVGVGAIGVGFINDANVEVDGNIINVTGGDYSTVSTYEKLGAGNAAILDKSGNTGVVIGENTIIENFPAGDIVISDSNYAIYFNDDGTIKDDAPINANDVIFLGELNNKKLVIDVPLTIKGADNNKLTNTTISLVAGADGTTISGLDMDYEDDGSVTFAVIAVNNGVSNVVIANNTINAVTAPSWNYDMGISVYGAPVGSENITISGNTITMSGNAGGLYGIDVQNYDPYWAKGNGTTGLNISGNTVTITGTGMVEPIYIASCNDILVDGNKITSSTNGGDAYGIGTSANNNFTVTNNEINVLSENNMAYGVASPDSTDVVIDNNNITAVGVGAIGVGFVNDANVEVDGNIINITGDDYTTVSTYEKLGTGNAAILDKSENTGVAIGENTIIENCPLTITDANYATYFNEDGTLKDDAPINANDLIFLGELNNKKFVIDIPLTVKGANGNKLTNTTIDLVEGADGTVISGLNMEFTGNSPTGIIYAKDVSNIVISNNNLLITDCTSQMMGIQILSEGTKTNNIVIANNTVDITGTSKYIYGIDAYSEYSIAGATIDGLVIDGNDVTINGASTMAEAIYVSIASNVEITNNEVTTTSPGRAYGIAASSVNGLNASDNTLNVNATTTGMAYAMAITGTSDSNIADNTITVEGTGAIGIALKNDNTANIEGNTITVTGGDFETATATSSLGKANAGIYNKGGCTDLTIGENTIVVNGPKLIDDSTYDQYFGADGKLKDDCSIVDGDTLLLGTLTNKKLITDIPLDIKGLSGNNLVNTTISLIAGADGTNVTNLNMNYEDDGSATFAIIAVNDGVSDVIIADNTINAVTATSWNYDMAISVYGAPEGSENIAITGNTITMSGNAGGLYGIDVQNYDPYWNKGNGTTGLNISDNTITIAGSGMAEPIYVYYCKDVLVDNNKITSSSTGGDAYGIGTGSNSNITLTNNEIEVTSENNMAYGISSTSSTDVVIDDNNITASGVGAVGIGVQSDENVEIDGNKIDITGGDFTGLFTYDTLGTANAAILNKGESTTNLNVGENALTENGKAAERIITGNGTKDLQNIIDDAEAGSTVDLTGLYFKDVGTVVLDKDIAITGGKIIGAENADIFEIAPKSENGPSEVNITGVNILVNNGNTIVKVTGENATDGTSIEVPAINIKDNNIELANDNVVAESVTVLELDSERPVLSPTNDIAINGNTIAAGIDPFDFKVTSITSGGDTVITPQDIVPEKKATVIHYENMNTTAVDQSVDGRVGEWFEFKLTDTEGNPIANTPMQIGFLGVVYDESYGIVTDANGVAKLQINLGWKNDYTFAICFLGNDEYNASFVVAKINVAPQKGSLTVPNKSYSASAKTKTLTATFKSASGKPVAGKKITFTVNGKTYSAKTNDKGVASVNVSLSKKGTYSFTAKFATNGMYATMTKTAKLTIK